MSLKLNIGCGAQRIDGWIAVDRVPMAGVTVADATALPFGNACAECVLMADVIEHLHPFKEVPRALAEVYRVLEPGGVVRLATPDFDKLVQAAANGALAALSPSSQPSWYGSVPACLQFSAHAFGNNAPGTPPGAYDGHQAIYDFAGLCWQLHRAGFRELVRQTPHESLSEAMRHQVYDRWTDLALIVEARKW